MARRTKRSEVGRRIRPALTARDYVMDDQRICRTLTRLASAIGATQDRAHNPSRSIPSRNAEALPAVSATAPTLDEDRTTGLGTDAHD